MNEEIKSALNRGILKCLPILHQLTANNQEPYLVWSKQKEGSWSGEYQQRTNVGSVLIAAEKQLEEAASDFTEAFFAAYPDYGGGKLVGCAGMGSMQLAHQKSYILKQAILCLWQRHETFDCSEARVDDVVSEFAEFVDSPTIRVRFWSQLLNYKMPVDGLRLAGNLTIRKLDERQISALQGGALFGGLQRQHDFMHMIHEFVIEGEFDVVKTISGTPTVIDNPIDKARLQLNRAVLCLRTFTGGWVGTDWLHFTFSKFCPLVLGSYGSVDQYVPFGNYAISEGEVPALSKHAEYIFNLSEPALETACARLSDAEGRFRPQDQILDAVIGMEALLLAGLGKEDRRSELKYRFSLNYSTLFDLPEERWNAYKVAKDLYDHRSTIAHGGDIGGGNLRVGEERLNPHQLAKRAKDTLRKLIKHFLPESESAPYKQPVFWERAYFRVS